jgi:glucose/arabinose dehydrogenase
MTFYTGKQFPSEYAGDAFAAEHGSWNRDRRTGYKVIRIPLRDGAPTGEYVELTGCSRKESLPPGRWMPCSLCSKG